MGWAGMLPCLLPAYRITEIPRRDDGPAAEPGQRAETSDPGRAQRVAALVAAYHAGVAEAPRRTALSHSAGCGWRRAALCGLSPRATRWPEVR